MEKRIKTALCVCISTVFLTACGGGSGSGDDDDLLIPVVPLGEDVDSDVVDPLPINVAPDPNPDPDPSPVASPITDETIELSKMFGTTDFTFQFEPSSGSTFWYRVNFRADGFDTSDSGILVLTGRGDGFVALDGSDDFGSRDETMVLGCASNAGDIVCIREFSSSLLDIFLFPNLTNGTSVGLYEFCTSPTGVADCLEDLLLTPDGTVVVDNIVPLFELAEADTRSVGSDSYNDSLNYRLYEKQSSPSLDDPVQSRQNADSVEHESRLAKLKELNQKVLGLLL